MNRFVARLLVLLLALAWVPVARADDVAEEADFRFRRAIEHYSKGRLEEALSEFYASNRLVRNRNVITNIGRCLEALGQSNEAYRTYAELLNDPMTDADRVSLEARLTALAPKVALVRVTSEPPGADVFVGRVDLGSRGKTPRILALPPGEAKLLVRLKGHRPFDATATLVVGKEAPVAAPLEFIWSTLALDTTPSGAEVRLDLVDATKVECRTPCELKLVPGRSTLHFTLPGFAGSRTLELAPDVKESINVALLPVETPKGAIEVTANRDSARVLLDGVASGYTPTVLKGVELGSHTVRVEAEGFETLERKVTVSENATAHVDAKLRVPPPQVTAATKSLTSALEAPASVTVITADELRAFGYQTLGQALKAVRGLYVSSDRQYDYLGVRGIQPPGDYNTRVTQLIDGHPVNEIWFGQGLVDGGFDADLSEVERIEVLRGPNSVLYGSSASLGVINVVRRAAPTTGRTVEAVTTQGNLGTSRGRITAGHAGEGWNVKATLAGSDSKGADSTTIEGLPNPVRGMDREQVLHGSLSATYGDFAFTSYWNDRTKQIPTAPYGTQPYDPRTQGRDTRGFAEGRWTKNVGFADVTVSANYDFYRYLATWPTPDENGDIVVSRDTGEAHWLGGQVRLRSAPIAGMHRFTGGGEFQRWLRIDRISYDVGGGETYREQEKGLGNAISAFAMWEGDFGGWLKLEAGLRFDQTPVVQQNLNPRFAALLRLVEGGLTKVIVGRGFRAPNLYELYFQNDNYQLANPALRPEVVWSGEIEHTQRLFDDFTLIGSLWGTDLDDRIVNDQFVANPFIPGQLAGQHRNLAQTLSLGAEAELRWQPTRLTLVSFSYAFQYTRELAHFLDGQALDNSPAHLAVLRGMHPISRWLTIAGEAIYGGPRLTRGTLDASGQLVGRFATGEQLGINVSLSGDVPGTSLRWQLAARNLLGDVVQEPAGDGLVAQTVPQYGRQLWVTLGAGL